MATCPAAQGRAAPFLRAPFYVDRSLLPVLGCASPRAVNVGPRPARIQRNGSERPTTAHGGAVMRNCKTGGRSERRGMARVPILLLAASAGLTVASFALPSWAQVAGAPELQVARLGHTATVLGDGRILIVGGENASGPVGQAEIFDPAS